MNPTEPTNASVVAPAAPPEAVAIERPPSVGCTLVIDSRERAVYKYEADLAAIPYVIKQITVGDYVVLSPADTIIAVIERKSLEDFAASLKDGRMDNKRKMLELRQETQCKVLYIIEGPPTPRPDQLFGRIPYLAIESCIFHLMIRDGITVIRTTDSFGTAQMLVRFIRSMNTLWASTIAPPRPIGGAAPHSALAEIQKPRRKTTHEVVREMWCTFRGISLASADDYIRQWSLRAIVEGSVSRAELAAFKLASNRAISSALMSRLLDIDLLTQTRLLAGVPGISYDSAAHILGRVQAATGQLGTTAGTTTSPLATLLQWDDDRRADVPVNAAGRRLGAKKAAAVALCFGFTTSQ